MKTMKITAIEAIPVNIPFKSAYFVSFGEIKPESVIVRMRTDRGIEGWGQASARPQAHGYSLEATVSTIRDILAPPLIGADPLNIRRLHRSMDTSIIHNTAARVSKAAIDMAAYDIAGKTLGVPVSTLLGGALRDRIPVCASSGGVGTPEEAAKQAKESVSKGFKNLKMKGSQDPWADVQRLAAVREAVGNDIPLRVDPNEGYGNADMAIPALKAMEAYHVTLIESPLPGYDYYGLARLCRELVTPVVIHQGLESAEDVVNLIRYGAGDVFNITVQLVGGLYEAMKILAIAESFSIPVLVGSARDTAIGTAASAHLASVIRHLPYACDCRFHLRYVEDIAKEPIRIEGGYTYVPQGPGLGIEIDEDKLRKYRLD